MLRNVVQDADELSTVVQPAGKSAHEQMVQLLHRQGAQENSQGRPIYGMLIKFILTNCDCMRKSLRYVLKIC